MNSHPYDADVSFASEAWFLETLMIHPVRIPMIDMKHNAVISLRERGLILLGQEMVNCIGIHDTSGDIIIQGEPSLYAWIVLSPKGRLEMQKRLPKDEWAIEVEKQAMKMRQAIDAEAEAMYPGITHDGP